MVSRVQPECLTKACADHLLPSWKPSALLSPCLAYAPHPTPPPAPRPRSLSWQNPSLHYQHLYKCLTSPTRSFRARIDLIHLELSLLHRWHLLSIFEEVRK